MSGTLTSPNLPFEDRFTEIETLEHDETGAEEQPGQVAVAQLGQGGPGPSVVVGGYGHGSRTSTL